MPPSDSPLRRLTAVVAVGAGLALIGASAGGVVALDSQLEAAAAPAVPTRMVEDYSGRDGDGRCREPRPEPARSPEV